MADETPQDDTAGRPGSDEDPVMTDDAGGAVTGQARWRARVALGLLALLVVLLGVLAFTQQNRIGDLEDDLDREDAIASSAGSFAEALLTYDHADLDAATGAVAERATDSFADEYRNAFESGLGAQIRELEATSTATIREVLVNRSEGDTARVVVVADTDITSSQGSEARVGSYIDMALVRIDGEWLVDEVQSVANTGGGAGTPTPGAGTGSTTTSPDSTEPESTTTTAPNGSG